MRDVRRSALVPHTPAEMYALVNDVARYPEFVPGCRATRVLAAAERELTATLELGRAGVALSITTHNTMVPGERVELDLADGPFRHFHGRWDFIAIRDPAGAVRGCRVELEVSFEFTHRTLGVLLGPLFESTWDSIVDAFVKRARQVYGT